MLALMRNRVSGACVTASAMRSIRAIRRSRGVTERFSAGSIAASGLLAGGGGESMEARAAVARAAAAAADKAVVICSRLSPPDSTRTPASAGRERLGATGLLGGTWLEAPMARTERTSVCLSLESQEVMRRSCGAPRRAIPPARNRDAAQARAHPQGATADSHTFITERVSEAATKPQPPPVVAAPTVARSAAPA